MATKKASKVSKSAKLTPKTVVQNVKDNIADLVVDLTPKVKEEKNLQSSSEHALWSELKDRQIQAFGLPKQKVCDHVKFKSGAGSKIIVTLRASAILPLLEETFFKEYLFEQSEKYVVITKI